METSGIYHVQITFPNADSIKYGLFTDIRVFDKRNNIGQVSNTPTCIHVCFNRNPLACSIARLKQACHAACHADSNNLQMVTLLYC